MKKLIIVLCATVSCMMATAQEYNKAALVVQEQIVAYNARNLDAFAALYSDDIIIYKASGEVSLQGKAQLKELFGTFFKNNPDLYCYIEDRIVLGDTVIDHEKIQLQKGRPFMEFIAMYKVKDGKIAEVHFLKSPY
ncbi:MAG: nuclear transport factor 2 family protein [Bacteroidota bacterium]